MEELIFPMSQNAFVLLV